MFGCSATHGAPSYVMITPEHRSLCSQIGAEYRPFRPGRRSTGSDNLNLTALVEPVSSSTHLPTRPRSTASRTSSFRCSAAPPTLLGAHASGPSRHWRPAQHKPRPSCPAGPRAPRHPAPSSRAARCSAREPSSLALGSSLLLIRSMLLCSCVQLSRSALLFLLHISHPHAAHPLQGAGRGSGAVAGCRGKRQAAGGSSRRWAGGRHDDGGGREGTGGRGRWRGGAQGARVGWERGRVRTARASEGA